MKLTRVKSKAFFALVLVLCITGILGMHTVYAKDGPEEGQLVLYAPKDVTVNLYGGLPAKSKADLPEVKTENLVEKSKTETNGDITYHYYNNLSAREDGYHYIVSGDAYYTVIGCIYYPEEKAASINEINVDPGKMVGNGYEPATILFKNSDELLEKVTPVNPEWKTKYPYVYETPTIKAEREDKIIKAY